MQASTMTQSSAREVVQDVLSEAREHGRTALSALQARTICEAYGITTPAEGLARSAQEAVRIAEEIGYPVVAKIVSPDILHKTEAGGVLVGLGSAEQVSEGYEQIVAAARRHDAGARIEGVQIQQMLDSGLEVMIGAIRDATFGPLVSFGLGGVLVEVLRDVTFRLAPVEEAQARSMLDSIRGAEVLRGVRGRPAVDAQALMRMIVAVSRLIDDFPEIAEIDLNPVLADGDGATAVDARVVLSPTDPQEHGEPPARYDREQILATMRSLMQPRAIAVIGASDQAGKIGNSVMRNLIDGGFAGEIYPVNPKGGEILGRRAYTDVQELPEGVDAAVFCIPAKHVIPTIAKLGAKGIPAAILIPSGFAETGEVELQRELVRTAREHGVRFVGPNIYGVYYTPAHMSAAFTTPYDLSGPVALASQSGGIGMAILGFSRSSNLGVSAIVGLGNKADID